MPLHFQSFFCWYFFLCIVNGVYPDYFLMFTFTKVLKEIRRFISMPWSIEILYFCNNIMVIIDVPLIENLNILMRFTISLHTFVEDYSSSTLKTFKWIQFKFIHIKKIYILFKKGLLTIDLMMLHASFYLGSYNLISLKSL